MHSFTNDDQSDFLVHLVGKNDPYNSFMSLLYSGCIEAKNSFGFKKSEHKIKSACFSEIPPPYLQKLVKQRYNYGVAFKKEWLLKNNGQRVWYIEKNSTAHTSLENMASTLVGPARDAFLELAPFIDIPGEYENSTYRFEWEREWRVAGNLSFLPSDVEFLILPKEVHEAARDFFQDAQNNHVGPNYNCPYYDPLTNTYSEQT